MPEDAEALVIEKLQTQIADLDRQSADRKRMVNQLCEMSGREPLYPDAIISNTSVSVRPDEYYGMRLASAVKMVLARRKGIGLGASNVNDIYDELVRGGFAFEAKNDSYAKRGLYQALSKNTTTFHRLPNGTYGLPEWYGVKPSRRRPANGDEDEAESVVEDNPASDSEPAAVDIEAVAEATRAKPR
jgi:hypothetical protein